MPFAHKDQVEYALKIRYLFKDQPELKNSDVLIFHCPFDIALLEWIKKPSIFYDHRAVRPYTFNWRNELNSKNNLDRYRLKRERIPILKIFKELFKKPDVILNNSQFTHKALKKWLEIDSFVVYPPVDTEKFHYKKKKRDYFLSIQRINWQKRPEIQIEAFRKLKEKLFIVGPGMEDEMYILTKDIPNIEHLREVPERDLIPLIQGAKAVLQTGMNEDFGLVPIEAMACGIPSIVVDEGGFKESINRKELGIRIRPPYVASLKRAVKNFDESKYKLQALIKEVQKYGFKRFNKQLNKYVKLAIKRHENKVKDRKN